MAVKNIYSVEIDPYFGFHIFAAPSKNDTIYIYENFYAEGKYYGIFVDTIETSPKGSSGESLVMMPVVTEYNFVRIFSIGEKDSDPAEFFLGDQNQHGHSLRVFTSNGNAKAEAIKQLKGMIKCLEDIP